MKMKTPKTGGKLRIEGYTPIKSTGNNIRINGKKKTKKNKNSGQTRSREISQRDPIAKRNIVYGKMRLGGAITFLDEGNKNLSRAHLTTGSGDSQIAWTARQEGSEGNAISVEIVVPSSNATLAVDVVGTDITITVKSSGGNSQSTANQVINAIRDNASADALVRVGKGDGAGNEEVDVLAKQNLSGGGSTWLHTVHTLAWHEINTVDKILINGRQVTFGGTPDPRWATGFFNNLVFATVGWGHEDQAVCLDLLHNFPGLWTVEDRGRGCAYVYIITKFKDAVFSNGEPDFSFEITGKKVWDPRISQTVYSNNAALCIADYLTTPKSRGGYGVSWDKIDLDNLSDAANVCDHSIPVQGGSFEPRYTINTSFDTDLDPDDILQEMATSIAGSINRVNGKWLIFPGVWRPPVMTITDDDIFGPIELVTRNSTKDRFNKAKGTFLNPAQNFEQMDIPAIKNAYYLEQDGGVENAHDEELTMVTSPNQAQRILKIILEQSRQGMHASFPASLRTYQLHPDDVIVWNSERFSFTKYWEVQRITIQMDGGDEGQIYAPILELDETAEPVFSFNVGEENVIDIAPNSNFPDPSNVDKPTDVLLESGTATLYLNGDGKITSRLKVSYQTTDFFVDNGGYVEIQFKKLGATDWQLAAQVPGELNFHYITDVQDKEVYEVRLRIISNLGIYSAYTDVYTHTIVGKTEKPNNVSSFAHTVDAQGIILNWALPADLDLLAVEIRYSEGTESTWDAAIFLNQLRSTSLRVPIKPAGKYFFFIKTIDTSLNYSVSVLTTEVDIIAPPAPIVSSYLSGENLILTWVATSTQFAIDEFEIRYGDDFDTAVTLTSIKGNSHSIKVSWGGNRRFWVRAKDVAGNYGLPGSWDVRIDPSTTASGLIADALRNSITIRWNAPQTTTLPIKFYRVLKGDELLSATQIAEVDATFISFYEVSAGVYTYWIVPVDSAGNEGAARSVTQRVSAPQDFQLITEEILDPSTARLLENVAIEGRLTRGPLEPGMATGMLGGVYDGTEDD